MNKLNEKFYEKFQGEERSSLALAALARGDNYEVKRLYETCPIKTYSAPDYSFTGRMEALKDIVLFATVKAQFYYHEILMCEWHTMIYLMPQLGNFEDLSFLKLPSHFKHGTELNAYLCLKVEDIQARRDENIGFLKAIPEALTVFCQMTGVQTNPLFEWLNLPFLCPLIENYLTLEDIEVNTEFAEWMQQKFMEVWHHGVTAT